MAATGGYTVNSMSSFLVADLPESLKLAAEQGNGVPG